MITDKNYYKKVAKRIAVLLFTLLGIYIIFKLSIFYIPFLIALIISLLIEPLIRYVMKITNLTRKVSAIITLIIVFSVIIGLLIWGIAGAITESSNILNNLNENMGSITAKITNFIANFKLDSIKIPEEIKGMLQTTFDNVVGEGTNIIKTSLSKMLDMVKQVPQIFIYIGITILATYFVCTDKMYILDQLEHHLPQNWVNKIGYKVKKVISSLGGYLKAESILIIISFFIVLIGLFLFKIMGMNVQYPLMMALVIGFVDALPILGSGTVMIPWAVIVAFHGDIKLAIALIVLYVIVMVTKQLLEPRLVSSHIGTHPIFTLLAMYTGYKLIGIVGMLIGPVVLIILKNVFETIIDNGVVKTILDRK